MSRTNDIYTMDIRGDDAEHTEYKRGADEAFSKALSIIDKHRISGYFCSCGAEINSQEAHHSQMIRIAKES